MNSDDIVAAVAAAACAAIFAGAAVNTYWERKVHHAPLQCRVELLDDRTMSDSEFLDQPTSPGSGR